jgi:hypothetical protein
VNPVFKAGVKAGILIGLGTAGAVAFGTALLVGAPFWAANLTGLGALGCLGQGLARLTQHRLRRRP